MKPTAWDPSDTLQCTQGFTKVLAPVSLFLLDIDFEWCYAVMKTSISRTSNLPGETRIPEFYIIYPDS